MGIFRLDSESLALGNAGNEHFKTQQIANFCEALAGGGQVLPAQNGTRADGGLTVLDDADLHCLLSE